MSRIVSGLAWLVFGSMALFVGVALVLHWVVPDTTFPASAVHALAGYLWVPAVAVLALGLALAKPATVTVAALLMIGTLSAVVPGHIDHSEGGDGDLRIATANVLMVHPDPNAVITDLVAQDPDIIVLQEINPRWAIALETSSLLDAYPHRLIAPEEGSFGVAVLSKHPGDMVIEDLAGVMTARFDVQVGDELLRIYDVHTLPPRDPTYATFWAEQMAQLADMAAEADVPTVFAGDFNATRHHPSYKALMAAGLRDAHALTGQASRATWPNGLFPAPPLQLDHVLVTDEVTVHALWHGPENGSDHVPVIVEISVGETPSEPASWWLSS